MVDVNMVLSIGINIFTLACNLNLNTYLEIIMKIVIKKNLESASVSAAQLEKAKLVEKKSAAVLKELDKEQVALKKSLELEVKRNTLAKQKLAKQIKEIKAGEKAAKAFNKKGEGTKEQNKAIAKAAALVTPKPKMPTMRLDDGGKPGMRQTVKPTRDNTYLNSVKNQAKQNLKGALKGNALEAAQEDFFERFGDEVGELPQALMLKAARVFGLKTVNQVLNVKDRKKFTKANMDKALDILGLDG